MKHIMDGLETRKDSKGRQATFVLMNLFYEWPHGHFTRRKTKLRANSATQQ